MDISKIWTAICGLTLAVCLTLSITTLTVLRNAVKENDAIQRQAQSLMDELNDCVEVLNQTQTNAEDSLPTSADTETVKPVTDAFVVREVNGKIGVYTEDGYLIRLLEVSVDMLPAADRELLQKGIRVESWKELISLMQDYGA